MDFEVACSGLAHGSAPAPCIIVIFGISGDLARHELIPSLFALQQQNLLPESFAIVGFARREWDDEALRREMHQYVAAGKNQEEKHWREFARKLFYIQGNFNDSAAGAYADLRRKISQLQKENNMPTNVLFHLSTPPSFYGDIMQRLSEAKLLEHNGGWRRVIVEKPFGADEASAQELDQELQKVIDEKSLYRVDHFLGKETVQNMLVFRFANPSFEPIWNRDYIDHVQITAAESEGIGTRGNFYEPTGVVRDMMQNHMLQLLCMTAMEPPVSYEGNSLRDETVKVLRSVRQLNLAADCVLGQYGVGAVNGESATGYREENDVAVESTTPTYAAFRLHLDNWRWAGVPFYLRTGKRLRRKATSISIHFKPTPHLMFPLNNPSQLQHSVLTFRLYPEEGILHTFLAKQPGPDICLQPVTMRFRYDRAFGIDKMPGAYQWLLLDAMQGDQTLFPRADWVHEAWSIVDPIIRQWEEDAWVELPNYAAGSWGPLAADELIAKDGREWQVR